MKGRLYELDALRGVAALSVLLFHYFVVFRYIQRGQIPETLFIYGVTGVDLFFMISGYVIYMTATTSPNWRRFLISRFSRLYPAYWVSILLTAAGLKIVSPENSLLKSEVILTNMTMFQRWMNIPDISPPYWTLSVELMFYFVVVIFLVAGRGKDMEKAGIYLFSVLVAGIFISDFSDYHAELIEKIFPLFAHVNLFFAGILFYLVKEKGNTVLRTVGILGMSGMVFPLHYLGGTAKDFISPALHTLVTSLYFFLFFLLVNGWLKFIATKSLVFLGEISYSLYLIHQTIGFISILFFMQQGLNHPLAVLITFFLIITLAAFITFYIEKPSMKRLRGFAE